MKNLFEIEHNYMSIPNKVIAEDMIDKEIDNVKEFIRHMVKRQENYVMFFDLLINAGNYEKENKIKFERISVVNNWDLSILKTTLKRKGINLVYPPKFRYICYKKDFSKYIDLLNYLIKKL